MHRRRISLVMTTLAVAVICTACIELGPNGPQLDREGRAVMEWVDKDESGTAWEIVHHNITFMPGILEPGYRVLTDEQVAAIEAHNAEMAALQPVLRNEHGDMWDLLAECESNQTWDIATGNGYYGGLQFALESWRAVGGQGYPHHFSREVQIHFAEELLDLQGWRAWPACTEELGWR
jgi:hypothetical protein